MVNCNKTTQERDRQDAVRPSWAMRILSAACYVFGGVFVAVMATTAANPLGMGLAGMAACLFIICGRIAGGERVE